MQLSDINLIVSANNSWYLDYAKLVTVSYRLFFPEFKLHLAIVTNDKLNIAKYQEIYDSVVVYPDLSGIPSANQGKVARLIRASEMGESICMIEDIDTVPLQRDFIVKIVNQCKDNSLNAVGHECYSGGDDSGKFPMSNVTAKGEIFRQIFNPNNLEWAALLKTYNTAKIHNKEMIQNDPGGFSDESLLRALIQKNFKGDVNKITRGIVIKNDWINRVKYFDYTTFETFNRPKLASGGYILTNLMPNPKDNFTKMKEVFDYLYNKDTKPEDLFL